MRACRAIPPPPGGSGSLSRSMRRTEPPELFILELGGNDLLRGLPPAQTRDNIAAMLAELRERDIPVLLMGMRAPPNLGAVPGAVRRDLSRSGEGIRRGAVPVLPRRHLSRPDIDPARPGSSDCGRYRTAGRGDGGARGQRRCRTAGALKPLQRAAPRRARWPPRRRFPQRARVRYRSATPARH